MTKKLELKKILELGLIRSLNKNLKISYNITYWFLVLLPVLASSEVGSIQFASFSEASSKFFTRFKISSSS